MYILIMTLVLSGGGAAISNLETSSLTECGRIGSAWVDSVKGAKRQSAPVTSFVCIELD